MATAQRMEPEDQEALFSSTYPCSALYYVQSPSTASHATTDFPHDDTLLPRHHHHLSRCSSSRASNNSFPQDKKILPSFEPGLKTGRGRLRIVSVAGEEEEEEGSRGRGGIWRVLALDGSAPCVCVVLQVGWRLLVSILAAVLVFFLATRPPAPKVSAEIARVRHFNLGEGLDGTGVATKVLTCNASMDLEIDNKSKLFGLHLYPLHLEMAFGALYFATSQAQHSYVQSDSTETLRLYVGVKDMPVYGAGRAMQDLLESGRGLPLTVRLTSKSSYHVVWSIIRSGYHHRAECLVILNARYDVRRHTHLYNSSCFASTSHA